MKKKLLKRFSLGLLATFLALTSCAPNYYLTNPLNMPMLEKKGQVQINLNGGLNGLNLQSAVALKERIGLMVNAQYLSDMFYSNFSKNGNIALDIGLGFSQGMKNGRRFEFYGGFGFGTFDHTEEIATTDPFYGTVTYLKGATSQRISKRLFLQPAYRFYMFSNNNFIFSSDLGLRNTVVTYRSYHEFDEHPQKIDRNRLGFYLTPAVTHNIGYNDFSFYFQYGFNMGYTYRSFDTFPIILTAGLNIKFN